MAEFEANQFRPNLEEELGPELTIIVEALSNDPTALIPTLQALLHQKIIEFQEEVRIRVEQEIEEIKQKILEQLPTKEELIELLTSFACSPEAQKAMKALYDSIKDIIAFAKDLAGPVLEGLNYLVEKGEQIKEGIRELGENLLKFTTIIAIIAAVIVLLRGILFTLALIPPPFTIPYGILAPIDNLAKKIGNIVDVFVSILIDSIPETLAAFGNLIVKITAQVTGFVATVLGLIATIEAIERALEALYLKYLQICNTVPTGTDDQGLLNGGDDVANYSNAEIDKYYDDTLASLRASGNDEVIEKIYSANFQQIGFKRYKI